MKEKEKIGRVHYAVDEVKLHSTDLNYLALRRGFSISAGQGIVITTLGDKSTCREVKGSLLRVRPRGALRYGILSHCGRLRVGVASGDLGPGVL